MKLNKFIPITLLASTLMLSACGAKGNNASNGSNKDSDISDSSSDSGDSGSSSDTTPIIDNSTVTESEFNSILDSTEVCKRLMSTNYTFTKTKTYSMHPYDVTSIVETYYVDNGKIKVHRSLSVDGTTSDEDYYYSATIYEEYNSVEMASYFYNAEDDYWEEGGVEEEMDKFSTLPTNYLEESFAFAYSELNYDEESKIYKHDGALANSTDYVSIGNIEIKFEDKALVSMKYDVAETTTTDKQYNHIVTMNNFRDIGTTSVTIPF
jgi:hypothetical protein